MQDDKTQTKHTQTHTHTCMSLHTHLPVYFDEEITTSGIEGV
jgi:hypothetical protein